MQDYKEQEESVTPDLSPVSQPILVKVTTHLCRCIEVYTPWRPGCERPLYSGKVPCKRQNPVDREISGRYNEHTEEGEDRRDKVF